MAPYCVLIILPYSVTLLILGIPLQAIVPSCQVEKLRWKTHGQVGKMRGPWFIVCPCEYVLYLHTEYIIIGSLPGDIIQSPVLHVYFFL